MGLEVFLEVVQEEVSLGGGRTGPASRDMERLMVWMLLVPSGWGVGREQMTL